MPAQTKRRAFSSRQLSPPTRARLLRTVRPQRRRASRVKHESLLLSGTETVTPPPLCQKVSRSYESRSFSPANARCQPNSVNSPCKRTIARFPTKNGGCAFERDRRPFSRYPVLTAANTESVTNLNFSQPVNDLIIAGSCETRHRALQNQKKTKSPGLTVPSFVPQRFDASASL